ncbi:MAG TPA: shikimate kinase [Bacteroidia bacterium]|nr:shikimate kinase [Bacteroidia bacterium]
MRIYLLGYMGAGKSHLGKILAERLGYSFVDTDAMVEATTGKSIRQLFEEQGEGAFRIAEQKALHATGQQPDLVVATGGGLPTFADNLTWMNSNGMTVYLQVSPGTLFHRLVREREHRPLLAGIGEIDLMETIHRHLIERSPYYQQARLVIDPEQVSAGELVAMIMHRLDGG